MGDHGFARLEHHADGRYVIVCGCGWSSTANDSAEVVGNEFDEHLAAASATNRR